MRAALRTGLALIGALFVPATASAHEAYVLPKQEFWSYMHSPFSPHAFAALQNPHNVVITTKIVTGVLVLLTLNYLFRRTGIGQKVHRAFESLEFYGPFFVRAAIAAAFFYSALSWSFLGPELALHGMPYPNILRAVLFAASAMFAFGFLTEVAAFAGIVVYTIGFAVYGAYIATYLNYLGELIVLFLFGMRHWSVDGVLFGSIKRLLNWEKYETTIVRVCYGLALAYAGLTVKFLHPDLTVEVATHWNLMQFHWLFPSDPLLITMGAGLAEMFIGLFTVFGFELRLTTFISLFYITLSLIYFRELVWPHLMLYGISINLILQPEVFTVDHLLFAKHRREHRWWKRPLLPHGSSKQELAEARGKGK